MRCPACGKPDSKVIDSRPVDEGTSIRRRRECPFCGKRFTTYEVVDNVAPIVVKKDGSRQYYDKNKILSGIVKACEKRPVDTLAVANEIEAEIFGSLRMEITSHEIGEMVMEKLRALDDVAYVRFASVHREFKDVQSFVNEIAEMHK